MTDDQLRILVAALFQVEDGIRGAIVSFQPDQDREYDYDSSETSLERADRLIDCALESVAPDPAGGG